MAKRVLPTLKVIVLIFTIILALIVILYVLGLFPAEHTRRVIAKTMGIMVIVVGASLITLFLSTGQTKH
jgi:hypothetical protein